MAEALLQLEGFTINSDTERILAETDLTICSGTSILITGEDAGGLHALGPALAGSPAFRTEGSILLAGSDISHASAAERSRRGLFLAWNEPPVIPGLKLEEMLKEMLAQHGLYDGNEDAFAEKMIGAMEILFMHPSYAGRDMHEGLTPGDRKRCEVLQLMLLHPLLAVLDGTFDDPDEEMTGATAAGVKHYLDHESGTAVIISETGKVPGDIRIDRQYAYTDGRLVLTAAEEV